MQNPTIWPSTFCAIGDARDIPEKTEATSGRFSFEKGFGLINATPLAAGGIAPEREDFNGIFRLIGDNITFLQLGGCYQYDAALAYQKTARVMFNGECYQSLADNNSGHTPDTAPDYWRRVGLSVKKVPSIQDIDAGDSGTLYICAARNVSGDGLPNFTAGDRIPNPDSVDEGAGVMSPATDQL